jgi:threonylcarbamoyladenosine tRNA methylthiotransferase MtaB
MKIYLDMVGCRLNQSEIEKLAFELRNLGHQIVSEAADADIAIVNTCTVTASAAADSRKVIRRIQREGCEHIIATGCLATIEPETILNLPAVESVFSNQDKDTIVASFPSLEPSPKPHFRIPIPGKHKRTRAFIKVQDGCDNFCTFCITRIARGESRSTGQEEIFRDIESAISGGVKEIVLTGVNLGSWGRDFNASSTLSRLIKDMVNAFDIPRIRLSSIEPWDVDEELLDIISLPNFAPHLHLPLQSGCDRTLKRMGRKMNSSEFEKLIYRMRAIRQDIAITTDIIVGFPEESEDDFANSLNFVEKISFAGGHVFRYSPRNGTPAAAFPGKISGDILRERSKRMREVIKESQKAFEEKALGEFVTVLWEKSKLLSASHFSLHGLSGNYLNVETTSCEDLTNEISIVQIKGRQEKGVYGEIKNL